MYKLGDFIFNEKGELLKPKTNGYFYMTIKNEKSERLYSNRKKYTNFLTIIKDVLRKLKTDLENGKNSAYKIRIHHKEYSCFDVLIIFANPRDKVIYFNVGEYYLTDKILTYFLESDDYNYYNNNSKKHWDKNNSINEIIDIIRSKKTNRKEPFYKKYNINSFIFHSEYSIEDKEEYKKLISNTFEFLKNIFDFSKIPNINKVEYISRNRLKKYAARYLSKNKTILLHRHISSQSLIHEYSHHIDYSFRNYNKEFTILYDELYKELSKNETLIRIGELLPKKFNPNNLYEYLIAQHETFARVLTQYVLDNYGKFDYEYYNNLGYYDKLFYFSKEEIEKVTPIIEKIIKVINE